MRLSTASLALAFTGIMFADAPGADAQRAAPSVMSCPRRDSAQIVRDAIRALGKRVGTTAGMRVTKYVKTDSGTVVSIGAALPQGRRVVQGGGGTVIVPTYFAPCVLEIER